MSDIQMFIGHDNISISEAMMKIDQNAYGVLFLTDSTDVIIGCVTDGDIRRYLLSGGNMNDNVMKAANKHPRLASNEAEAKTLYHKRNYAAIPIVKSDHIVDIFFGEGEQFTEEHIPLNIPVVINAGGKGTRLDPLTRILPKPLLPVGDLPIIERIMAEYSSYSCNDFHIIVNYKKELIKAFFKENERSYNITWYDEKEPLGTGGGLSLLKGKIDNTFFFVNCDVLLKTNYEDILKFHVENRNTITIVCAYKNISIPYGVVEIGTNGVVEKMTEKPLVSFLTNTGIYVVQSEVIDDLDNGVAIDFPEVIEMQRKKGKKIAAYPVKDTDWMDMGQFPELRDMNNRLLGETC